METVVEFEDSLSLSPVEELVVGLAEQLHRLGVAPLDGLPHAFHVEKHGAVALDGDLVARAALSMSCDRT